MINVINQVHKVLTISIGFTYRPDNVACHYLNSRRIILNARYLLVQPMSIPHMRWTLELDMTG